MLYHFVSYVYNLPQKSGWWKRKEMLNLTSVYISQFILFSLFVSLSKERWIFSCHWKFTESGASPFVIMSKVLRILFWLIAQCQLLYSNCSNNIYVCLISLNLSSTTITWLYQLTLEVKVKHIFQPHFYHHYLFFFRARYNHHQHTAKSSTVIDTLYRKANKQHVSVLE